jgi:signal transduction histidine kinase
VALAVKMRLIEGMANKESEHQLAELAHGLVGEIGDALESLRELAHGIYPPLLADQGLAAALSSQARKATIPVDVDADGLGRYPQDVEAAVYFCCLEALQNVGKYANATAARITLAEAAGVLRFEVADDGDGFDRAAVTFGSGMQGMADRLDAIGGSLEVRSSPGSGTTVVGSLIPRPGYRSNV